ncbi:hypothetical protein BDL97_12G064400 [Sphagnum fallax]|nr:hypothetical protein BDL97_12G064400 [Sphagnum fallax]
MNQINSILSPSSTLIFFNSGGSGTGLVRGPNFPQISIHFFRTFFGVDYLQQQLGLVCEFEESPWKLLFSDRKMEEENKSEAPVDVRDFCADPTCRTKEKDLLVVGPGVLGSLIATIWLQQNAGCKVVGQTNTTNHHEELQALGIHPITKDEGATDKYPFVVFSAPPHGSENYITEVRAAAERWNGVGSLLFTSSTAVYDVSDNGPCDENSPIVGKGRSPRTDVLLGAEEEVLKVGGSVVRLVGLYNRDRGAHVYWLKKEHVDARPDYILNLIHYEDAAALCINILSKMTRGQIFLGCDNTPVSRQEIMDVLKQNKSFESGDFQGFTVADGPLGKKITNNETRRKLGWQPKYGSFASFVNTL